MSSSDLVLFLRALSILSQPFEYIQTVHIETGNSDGYVSFYILE